MLMNPSLNVHTVRVFMCSMRVVSCTGDCLSFLLLTPFPLSSGTAQMAGITRFISEFRWAIEIQQWDAKWVSFIKQWHRISVDPTGF